ncbi:thioesterase superfamily protein [Zymoseptoria brevis]|uniref:Thioesterase superfamily protein n=1 Tax=Zymoseptoria brevis TaxID=1047168 RepID=A0A0F4G9F5_9PEZI|nr:thioesterase superfamily protein [Zymoseptoria brevis]
MSRFDYSSISQGRDHPDFASTKWVQDLLNDPNIQHVPERGLFSQTDVSNTMFDRTLSHPEGIRARILFRRLAQDPNAASKYEECYLMSVGDGLDGKTGRAHGGLTSVVLDQLLGGTANRLDPARLEPPATATLTVDYKAPISTPCIILARSWATEITGRKVFLAGTVEDGQGRLYATGKALFVNPRSKANM